MINTEHKSKRSVSKNHLGTLVVVRKHVEAKGVGMLVAPDLNDPPHFLVQDAGSHFRLADP